MTEPNTPDIALRLEQLTELSVELSANRDTTLLLEKILRTAKGMTHADGGTLYRVSADKKSLCFSISLNDTLGMYQGGMSGNEVAIPDIPLYSATGAKNLGAVAAYAANTGVSVNIQDVYRVDIFNFSGMRKFDEAYHYHSQSFLTVPMQDHEGEVIGVLQLINAKDPQTGTTQPFSETDQRFIEALASQAAIALTNQQLIARLEDLFESFVTLINIGIDEKSPHTGRHCHHVPQLTMMLADAAHEIDSGPLAGFEMTKSDRKQLWLAGLLHDCGKITTPVHVVEKATKLETIFDRIHMVDTRFEVVKRDAEIRALKEKLASGNDPTRHVEIDRTLTEELVRMDADRDFLRRANIGGEVMSEDDQKRVAQIAARYRWTAPDGYPRDLLSEEEIGNLTIRAGTLNQHERDIINNHIVVTIRMLESLPWPKHLSDVPEYAGGHHERMDGKGYPRGLRREEMSWQARMMAIADIFEALTAKDRPYKKGKTLSESLHILGGFKLRDHIDPDLFDIFIRKKVYLDYAKRFMDPAQIDDVDENGIPGYVP
ncbi:MAG TPA: HD domain-containing phosphohydrolase [Noviherbaspirillum sp.]|uniref:HD domain-containing phosphohydrolase n=1 Tax=Noviherbaspirillum sp. TaxID=1926288 RepID=UPI002B4A4638|nr:HD domain-containing phosphohydrolase [Noviherbaspirillum sp.]HJV86355.1 HD domain-containing phosphohydrolase [Noviherbaspirillum sp.]